MQAWDFNQDKSLIDSILNASALHAVEVQLGLQEQPERVFKAPKHFKMNRTEFIAMHRAGMLTRLPSAGWYLLREMPVWIE